MSSKSVRSEWLTVQDLATRFGISRSAAYRLVKHIPSHRLPGVGLRFRLVDVETFEQAAKFRRVPDAATPRRRAAGMPVALESDDDEVVFEGMTRRELREKAGW